LLLLSMTVELRRATVVNWPSFHSKMVEGLHMNYTMSPEPSIWFQLVILSFLQQHQLLMKSDAH
jgi:hypothetical protein